MTGLRPPPKEETPSRIFLRMLVLILLVVGAGTAVWTQVTRDRIGLIEDVTLEELDIEPVVTTAGTKLNVVREGEGEVPVVLLHDADVAGGVTWDGVVEGLDPRFTVLRVDLPGFGLSERVTTEGSRHTVASMAEEVSDVIRQMYGQGVVIAGAGLGGEVGAEIAATQPELVSGLVMVDVDFYNKETWVERIEDHDPHPISVESEWGRSPGVSRPGATGHARRRVPGRARGMARPSRLARDGGGRHILARSSRLSGVEPALYP
jgi:pimeloyl-ACP methyl ester carboxylesterase